MHHYLCRSFPQAKPGGFSGRNTRPETQTPKGVPKSHGDHLKRKTPKIPIGLTGRTSKHRHQRGKGSPINRDSNLMSKSKHRKAVQLLPHDSSESVNTASNSSSSEHVHCRTALSTTGAHHAPAVLALQARWTQLSHMLCDAPPVREQCWHCARFRKSTSASATAPALLTLQTTRA